MRSTVEGGDAADLATQAAEDCDFVVDGGKGDVVFEGAGIDAGRDTGIDAGADAGRDIGIGSNSDRMTHCDLRAAFGLAGPGSANDPLLFGMKDDDADGAKSGGRGVMDESDQRGEFRDTGSMRKQPR